MQNFNIKLCVCRLLFCYLTINNVAAQNTVLHQTTNSGGGSIQHQDGSTLAMSIGGAVNASFATPQSNLNVGFLQTEEHIADFLVSGPKEACNDGTPYQFQLKGQLEHVTSVSWWSNGATINANNLSAEISFPSWGSTFVVFIGVKTDVAPYYEEIQKTIITKCASDDLPDPVISGPEVVCSNGTEYDYSLEGYLDNVTNVVWWSNGVQIQGSGESIKATFPSWSSSFTLSAGVSLSKAPYHMTLNYDVDVICNNGRLAKSESNSDADQLALYPNPVVDYLFIDGGEGEYNISCINGQGVEVKTEVLTNQEGFDMTDLPSGVYTIITQYGSNTTQSIVIKK